LATLIASLAFVGACATERDPIDRTQPNALDKSMFVGEWYYQQTVVEIPGSWSPTFVGETNFRGMERIRWDVQEDWLYARRSYERIKGAEGATLNDKTFEAAPGKPYMGAVIAAYPIQNHFDIRRAYNSTTGEEYNVLEENSSDAPWYERKFMRVDWSKNYATNFDFALDDQPNYEGINKDPVAYYVQDPSDPDYPVIDPGKFDDKGTMLRQPYLDITNVMMLQPGLTYFKEYDVTYPTCWLFSRATADCTTEPVKIRSSFLRLDKQRQFVPQPFKGEITKYFGLFTNDVMTYDDQQEVTEKYKERYKNLHNLWKTWLDKDGKALKGSERGEVRPMIYYAHDWPIDLDTTLRNVEGNWNTIFQNTVAAAKATDADLTSTKPVNEYTHTDPVFVVCHVPFDASRGDKKELCVPAEFQDKPEDFKVRIGDVRYNFIAYVPRYYDGFALLGLGPSNTDPLTAETLSAGAYLYVYNDIVAQTTLEQIQLLNGELRETSYIDGLDLTAWEESVAANQFNTRLVTDEEKVAMVGGQSFEWTQKVPLVGGSAARIAGKSKNEVLREMLPVLYEAGMYNGDNRQGDGRLASLRGTHIETLMLNPEITLAAGIAPETSVNAFSQEMLNKASVSRIGPVKVAQLLQKRKDHLAHVRNVDLMAGVDDGYAGLALEFKGQDPNVVRAALKDKIFHAVLAHELGHSFNLHHNFGGTEDVVNYGDNYWKLRSKDGTVEPRWKDPITQEELSGNIYRSAYSSIMDYSRLTLDEGPGKYDAAAVLRGYADKVEQFVDIGGFGTQADDGVLQSWSSDDGSVLNFYLTGPESFHYTRWWDLMKEKVYEATNRKLADAKTLKWSDGTTLDGGNRVPYVFCSPYQTDLSNGCLSRDYGADEFERTQHHIQMANTWYITRAFTRAKVGASPEEYMGRSYDRIYGRLKGYNDYFALLTGFLRTSGYWDQKVLDEFLSGTGTKYNDKNSWAAYTIAMHDQVNFLMDTVSTPNVGSFGQLTEGAGQTLLSPKSTDTSMTTDVAHARFFSTGYGNRDDCGMYFWECLHHYGFYLDKIMAITALTDTETNFVGKDTAEDLREWQISFYDSYSRGIEKFFGSMLANDYENFAPRYLASQKKYLYHDFASDKLATQGTPVDPSAGFTVQLYAAILGMARWQTGFDKSFFNSSRMWLDGSKNALITGLPVLKYTDPVTGRIFVAVDRPDSVARRMLNRANTVYERSNYCTSDCVSGLTEADRRIADAEVVNYTELLDVISDVTNFYENGGPQY
jgi:hypothetical protein